MPFWASVWMIPPSTCSRASTPCPRASATTPMSSGTKRPRSLIRWMPAPPTRGWKIWPRHWAAQPPITSSSPTWSRTTVPTSPSSPRSTRRCRWWAMPRRSCIWSSSSGADAIAKDRRVVVKDGESLSLGAHTLTFAFCPHGPLAGGHGQLRVYREGPLLRRRLRPLRRRGKIRCKRRLGQRGPPLLPEHRGQVRPAGSGPAAKRRPRWDIQTICPPSTARS